MPAEASSAPASDGAQGGRGRPRQRRRGQRGGRGGQGQGRGGAAEQGGQSATTAPVKRTNDSPTPANDPGDAVASSSSRGRGRARGRGRGGGGGGLRAGRGGAAVRGGGFVAGTQRTFGGHLTSEMADGGGQVNGDAGLSAAAAEFVPGQAIAPKSRQPPRQKAPQYPLAPKSTAEDLPTRIHQDISNGQYELKNQPCWFEEVRCGLPCNEKLKCGTHTCKKQCHRPGQYQDNCHAPYPCKEDKACQAKEFITCACQHRKKEIKCLATRINPEPERETLKCDDECLRLQRNQKLAAALSIDPATHTDDHVPYSDTTLKLFRESVRWCQTQEREFRVFASDADEKRIRFKPMPPSQRAFLHALAEDFGLDTESQDPEPHRHVSVFKTPRFVSAPSKTLAQCVKIKNVQAAAAKAGASASEAPKQAPFNALLLSTPRFALTIEELDAALAGDFAAHNNLSFTTSFLPSDEVLVRATPVSSWGSSTANVETSLANLKPAIARTVAKAGLAGAVTLVHADQDQNVLRREVTGETKDAGGWSSVVGRRPQAAAPAPVEKKPASGFVSFSRLPRKKIVQETEEDWEAAAEKMDD
ncbi:FKBP12-associated protein 1 like [Verticillium longisporum]|nr:FKBP12-associated protein 1 like [Verticillium longisporum]